MGVRKSFNLPVASVSRRRQPPQRRKSQKFWNEKRIVLFIPRLPFGSDNEASIKIQFDRQFKEQTRAVVEVVAGRVEEISLSAEAISSCPESSSGGDMFVF